MKVLQINAVYGHGSTGCIAQDILLNVKKMGGKTYAAVPENITNCEELDGYIQIGNKLDYKMHALYSRIWGKQGYASRRATIKLINQIDKIKPDIIHLHNLHNNYINIKYLFDFIKNENIKTVITLHDCWFLTGKCCHFLYDGCYKWRTKCENCIRKKKEIPSYFFDASTKMYEDKKRLIGENPNVYVIGCSEWITTIARQSILSERTVGTIYNGIDLSVFYPRKNNLREKYHLKDKYVILGMANKWLSSENYDSFNQVLEFLTEDKVLFLLGCSEEQIKKLPTNTQGVGYITDKDLLAQFYSMADVFVNITKVDTLPTVNIESIACGTPVITYNSGGSAEIITDAIGISVDYGDTEGLVTAIKKIKKKGKMHYSKLCVEHARKTFERNECFDKYIDLYYQILNNEV